MSYLSTKEMEMSRKEVNLQITLGLQTCKTKGNVCNLLDEIRKHERKRMLEKIMGVFDNTECYQKDILLMIEEED